MYLPAKAINLINLHFQIFLVKLGGIVGAIFTLHIRCLFSQFVDQYGLLLHIMLLMNSWRN